MSYFFEFYNPVKIISGVGCIDKKICEQLKFYKCKKILVLSNEKTDKRGVLSGIEKKLNTSFKVGVFKNIENNVNSENVEKICSIYNLNACDSIVAVGDKNVLDTARVVRLVLSQQEEKIDKVIGYHMATKAVNIPLILLPTTIGNGSEVANQCVVYDVKKNKNVDIISNEMFANACMLDANILEPLKRKNIAMYKVLVLANCIEGLSSRKSSYIVKSYAYTLIYKLKEVDINSSKIGDEEKQKIMETSTLMAVMNCNNHLGVLSALASTISLEYNISYEEIVLHLLPSVLRINKEQLKSLYEDILFHLDNSAYNKYKDNRVDYFIEYVSELCDEIIDSYNLKNFSYIFDKNNFAMEKIINKSIFNCANLSNVVFVTENYIRDIINLSLEGKNHERIL